MGAEKGDRPHLYEVPSGPFRQMGPIPFFRTSRRYATIENAGRDEVVVEADKLREMDVLGPRQKQWETLKAVLGHEMTMAYLASPDARQPRLSFHTQSHAEVATVKARIGLAETILVIDANGAYRGELALRVDNATEQFLEIRLPEGGRLWTARVAGEPVKPTAIPGSTDPRGVRIPLIKTARGELYYQVVLKYGGRMPALGAWGGVAFPLIRSLNVVPDLSQVRLYVPEQYRWFDFGGTMRLVREEADLQAGYVQFQNNQLQQIGLALQQGDKWTKARAEANLKAQQTEMSSFRSNLSSASTANPELQSQLAFNDSIDRQVQRDFARVAEQPQPAELQDNRQRMNAFYQGQTYGRARNVVGEVGQNWADKAETGAGDQGISSQRGFAFRSVTPKPQRKSPAGGKQAQSLTMMVNPKIVIQEEEEGKLGVPTAIKAQIGGEVQSGVVERYKAQLDRQLTQQVQTYQYGGAQISLGSGLNPSAPLLQPSFTGGGTDYGGTLGRTGPYLGGLGGLGPGSPAPLSPATPSAPVPEAALPGMAPPANAGGELGAAKEKACAAPSYTVAKPGWGKTPAQPAVAAGLASLDFDLPTPGVLYRFTTPQGDVEITARNISGNLLRRLVGIAAVAVGLLVLWFVARAIRRANVAPPKRPIAAVVLIFAGLVSLCGGILPLAGLAAIAVGCGLEIHRQTQRT